MLRVRHKHPKYRTFPPFLPHTIALFTASNLCQEPRAVSFFVGAIPREEPQSLEPLQIVDGEGRHGGTTPTKPWFP